MTRSELLDKLQASRIPADSYCLSGGLPSECYILAACDGGWQVYYSERGQKTNCRDFSEESAACDHLFETIIREVRQRP
jgi:hypothetical protein